MNDFIKIDFKELHKYVMWNIETAPKNFIPAVAKGFINDSAFSIKKNTKKTMNKVFNYRNNKTKNYIESSVSVKKSNNSDNISSIIAEVGVVSGKEDQRKFYKREIASRQELGGNLKQVKSRGKGFRTQLMLPSSAKYRQNIRFKKAGIVRSRKDISNKKQRMAAAIKEARRLKKKYASTPYGIYRVFKGRAFSVRIFKPEKSVVTSKKPWLLPATNITLKKNQKLFIKNFNRQLKKFKIK